MAQLPRVDEPARCRLGSNGRRLLHFLVEASSSPTVLALRQEILARFPKARIHAYASAPRDNIYEGARWAFGVPLEPHLDVERADAILSLDADFLEARSENLAATRGFAARRDLKSPAGMNRLYVVEPRLSITGGMADHRLRSRSSDIEGLALAVLGQLGKTVPALSRFASVSGPALSRETARFVKAVAKDLASKAGRSLVVAGERQSPLTHAVAHAINASLGNIGATVRFTEPVVDTTTGPASWQPLLEELRAGRVDTLVITASNPAFSAPADAGLAPLLKRVPNVVYLGQYDDETGLLANWFIPAAHPFESWGDVRALDGTASIVQPLIAPLFNGLTEIEVLQAFVDRVELKPHEAVRATWKTKGNSADFDNAWETWLSVGVVPHTQSPFASPVLRADAVAQMAAAAKPAPAGLEVNFVTDYKVFDGRFGQNAWLQELPDPVSKVVWDNVALLSEATAAKLGVKTYDPLTHQYDLVTLSLEGRSVEAPAFVQPGCADDAVTVQLGYGKQIVELLFEADVPRVIGFNASRIRTSAAPWFQTGLLLANTGRSYMVATTQTQPTAADRPVALMQTVDEFQKDPEAVEHRRPTAKQKGNALPSVQKPVDYSEQQYKWGMSVDMSRCTGCSACVVACQAENNIPVVGKQQAANGRVMQWMRIGPLLLRHHRRPGGGQPADALPALRGRSVRVRLSGERHRAFGRRPQRHGLQPVHRYPLLLQQLPLQSSALQLPALDRRAEPGGADDLQPGRHRPGAWRDGEMHLLRPAHRTGPHRVPAREPDHPRLGARDRLPAGLPERSHRLWQSQ